MASTKRRRSATPESLPKERRIKRERQMDDDDDDDEDDKDTPWWMRPDPVKPGVPSSSPAPVAAAMTTKQPSPAKWGYRRRPTVKQEESTTQDMRPSSPPPLPAKQCKFAKAGCPFTGTAEQVAQHETAYCAPLYTQLAHFKMLAAARPSPSSPKKVDLPPLPSTSSNRSFRLSSPQKDVPMDHGTASASQQPDSATTSDALQHQVQRLQSDLRKAQKQLEDEKNLRTERLRKASERCLALMSLSEAGEGKAENLRMKLAAERNLREKLEEEVEYLRVAAAQSQRETSHQ